MPGWKEKRNAYCSASSLPQNFLPSKCLWRGSMVESHFLHAWLLECNGSSLRVCIPLLAFHQYNPSLVATWTAAIWEGRRDSETFLWLRIARDFVFWLGLNKNKDSTIEPFECSVDGTGGCLRIDGIGTLETGASRQKGLVKKENLINFDFDPCK